MESLNSEKSMGEKERKNKVCYKKIKSVEKIGNNVIYKQMVNLNFEKLTNRKSRTESLSS